MIDLLLKLHYESSVKIVGEHQHSGELGKVIRIETVESGICIAVKLESCSHGADECLITNPQNIVSYDNPT